MFRRESLVLLLTVSAIPAHAQLSQDARFRIVGSLHSREAAARIPMPLGKTGVELSDVGRVDGNKLQKELADNGQVITPGQVVTITGIEFEDKQIEFELDNGGTKKRNFLSNVQLSVGGGAASTDQKKEDPPAKGSKITLKFAAKIPPNMTPEQVQGLLNPLLDFSKQSLVGAAVESLPLEFQEAIKAKQARAGMNDSTVRLALGAPHRVVRDKSSAGVDQVTWIYDGRGNRKTYVIFERDVVVGIREY